MFYRWEDKSTQIFQRNQSTARQGLAHSDVCAESSPGQAPRHSASQPRDSVFLSVKISRGAYGFFVKPEAYLCGGPLAGCPVCPSVPGTFLILALKVPHSGNPSPGQTGTVGHPVPRDSPSASPVNPVRVSLCCLNHGEHNCPPSAFVGRPQRSELVDNWVHST